MDSRLRVRMSEEGRQIAHLGLPGASRCVAIFFLTSQAGIVIGLWGGDYIEK